jgi:hypothetical protein
MYGSFWGSSSGVGVPVKSFRAAADRIVRQESAAASTDALGLLSSVAERPRPITSEQDAWDARLAALSALGTYDALAVVATAPVRLAQSHNVSDPRVLHEAVAAASDEAKRRGAAVQLRAPTILADGRSANEIMVVPLTAVEGVDGVLVALRVGRGFSATDAVTASSVGTDVSLEVTRAALGRQDDRTRRQALALFELARAGLGQQELGERLLVMVEMAAKSLGHEVAQLWLLRGGGSLRLRAAYPAESLVLEIARPRDHAGLARSLEGEVVQVNDLSLRSWIRSRTRELIIAPLRDDHGVHGLLALGRSSERYLDDDLAMAEQCADFFEKIVAADAGTAREGTDANEAEVSLTGS